MRKVEWTIEKIANGFHKFNNEHGRYPTALEIDSYEHLPSSKQLQRRFGGLVEVRKQLKLDGPTDFTKGAHSSERAKMIGERAHKVEKGIYDYLTDLFGKPFVHREYFFTDDHRTRTDFFIYAKNGNFSVDVFYPKDKKNLIGCLNSKMRTYGYAVMINYPVIFLMMNEGISKEDIEEILERKKNKLHKQQCVMTRQQFEQFCGSKTPLTVGSRSIRK